MSILSPATAGERRLERRKDDKMVHKDFGGVEGRGWPA